MEEEKHKKKLILAIIGAVILVAGIVGLTYAYFRAQAESKDIVVSSRKLSIVFDDPDGSLIRANDIEPIADADIESKGTKKTFTIAKKDANDKDVYLRLELTDLVVSDNFKDSDLRWALYKSGTLVTEGSFVNVKDSTTLPLANNIPLDSTTATEYNFYIWIHETGVDQERLMNGTLSGKITVTGTENTQEGIVNEGKLADGMIPVVYDETNNVWVKAGGDLGWYDYSKQEWANAVTVKPDKIVCHQSDGHLGDITGVGYNYNEDTGEVTIPEPDGDITKEDSDVIMHLMVRQVTMEQLVQNTKLSEEEIVKRLDLNEDGLNDTSDSNIILNVVAGTEYICDNNLPNNSKEEYFSASPGAQINPQNIINYYTWIPRYKYKINNTGTNALPSMIDVEFESGVTSTGVSINTNGVAKTEYYTHPAFRDGSKVYKETPYDQSGWDKELPGFWINKFEKYSSRITVSTNINGLKNQVDRELATGSAFTDPNTTVHMMKNTEWGAIAYLSQSKYGKMGNNDFTGANKEIYINSSDAFITGRSAGLVPGASNISTSDRSIYGFNGQYCGTQYIKVCKGTKDVLKGVGASTSGTVYGVYDMVGGKKEHVMSNYNNSLASSGLTADFFTTEANKKLYDSYTPDKMYILGDATEETKGWYNDSINTMDTDNPFLTRGGFYSDGTNAGIFNSVQDVGSGVRNQTITRAIIIP